MSHDRHALEALVRAQLRTSGRGMSRRGFLRGASLAGLAVGAPGLLSACGTEAAKQTAESCKTTDKSAAEKTLAISNWPLYIDEKRVKEGGSKKTIYPTLEQFQEQSGITVDYTADYNDNNEFFGIVRNQLADCQPTGRDIFVPTDWMAARMIDLGWIQKLDKAKLPNVEANLAESLRSPGWDPNRDYSVPWQSGADRHRLQRRAHRRGAQLRGAADPAGPQGQGQPALRDAGHDAVPLLMTGADPSDFTEDEYGVAIDRLAEAVDAGQIRAFTGNDYAQDLVKGNVVACEAWSGDVIQLQFDNPNIKFVAPEEGLAALQRQHARAQPGRAQGERGGVDELLLPAGDRRRAGRLGELHLPGRGRRRRPWRRSTRASSTTR